MERTLRITGILLSLITIVHICSFGQNIIIHGKYLKSHIVPLTKTHACEKLFFLCEKDTIILDVFWPIQKVKIGKRKRKCVAIHGIFNYCHLQRDSIYTIRLKNNPDITFNNEMIYNKSQENNNISSKDLCANKYLTYCFSPNFINTKLVVMNHSLYEIQSVFPCKDCVDMPNDHIAAPYSILFIKYDNKKIIEIPSY